MEMLELRETPLFRGLDEPELRDALSALGATEREYKKGSAIFHAGSKTERMGLVLDGGVTIESNDAWGNRTILSHVGKGQVFAETYALLENEPLLVDATASGDCRVLFLKIGGLRRLMADSSSNRDAWVMKLVTNLLLISAHKNLALSGRSFHTSPKTIRGRVMAYLNSVSIQKGSDEFDIPFDRQQLADYLNLERTALSKELGKMRRDGIISVRKNHFALHGAGKSS